MLKSTLQEVLEDLAISDLGVSDEELMHPTVDTLIHLKVVATNARAQRIELLQKQRNLNSLTASDIHSLSNQAGSTNEHLTQIDRQVQDFLFRAKRAETLSLVLNARIAFNEHKSNIDSIEQLRLFISDQKGRKAIQTLVRENKKRKVGINMMDIIVCGAVPPYNFLLGGKLVSMLIASPQVIFEYAQKYKNHTSMIASMMKNDLVHKEPKLVFLGTTSLYHSGSSQYNRISLPLPDGNNRLRYENYGQTLGFGSVHFSEETIKALKDLQEHVEDAQLINNRFGEGVNPKLRRLRTGLSNIGLEKSDQFLNHRSKRIVYGVPLGKAAYDFLRGESENPEYFFDLSSKETIVKGTAYISEYWAKRWLLMRLENPEVLTKVSAFDRVDVALSISIKTESGTTLPESLQQHALFGGPNL